MRSDEIRPKTLAKRHAERRAQLSSGFRRESFTLPREEARAKARDFFSRYPKAAYMTEIEYWEELPDGQIFVTMRHLPTAD
ncbi:hypothetical protein ACMDCR_11200 [Labrys okinawensis]|uniref:hypothetical protein n=1 Tax=Labrys okinawensis TaxID=346911 RepID=UPI0039BC4A87